MVRFRGRPTEIRLIEELIERERPGVAVLYGRRRIGKTELIGHVLKDRQHFTFEGIEGQSKRDQIGTFLIQLGRQVGKNFDPKPVKNWREAFLLLVDEIEASPQPWCIVLDEFQWLANYRREIVSDLKMVWDQYLSKIPGTTLILCGSIASFMIDKVIKSTALYGRTDLEIHLGEFSLGETRELLGQDRGVREVLDARMMLGGVPMYLNLIKDAPSVRLGVEAAGFTPHSFFAGEFERIFVGHFGKHDDYGALVRVLAAHPYGLFRTELGEKAGISAGGGLSTRLGDLESAGFISSQTPFQKGRGSRHIKYFLTDAFLRFHLAFVEPDEKRIAAGNPDVFMQLASGGAFHAWMGRAFEYVCMAHAGRIAELLGFSGIRYVAGPYFRPPLRGRKSAQVDLVFDRADDVITVCEMKYGDAPVGTGVIAEVEKKIEVLREVFPRRTVQKVLVAVNGITRDLLGTGYFYKTIPVEDLF